MSRNLISISILSFLGSLPLSANDKIIYGEDNRVDTNFSPVAAYQRLAKSTAAMVPISSLKKIQTEGIYKMAVSVKSLGKRLNLCQDERFREQPAMSICSGFLVADDIMVTAGHCYDTARLRGACSKFKWVFDYKVEDLDNPFAIDIPEKNVYGCKRVLYQEYRPIQSKLDFAVIQLDRKVTDRQPLEVRLDGKVGVGNPVLIIGHPWGLPSKIADNAWVLDNSHPQYFVANLDSFEGNSGSAVFNQWTGKVEGVLVRGKRDVVTKTLPNGEICRSLNRCEKNGGNCKVSDHLKGEHITKISAFLEKLKLAIQVDRYKE